MVLLCSGTSAWTRVISPLNGVQILFLLTATIASFPPQQNP